MKYAILLAAMFLPGCSMLNEYGIGGPPRLACLKNLAAIDDRIVGSDDMHLSMVRRFSDGDRLCYDETKKPRINEVGG